MQVRLIFLHFRKKRFPQGNRLLADKVSRTPLSSLGSQHSTDETYLHAIIVTDYKKNFKLIQKITVIFFFTVSQGVILQFACIAQPLADTMQVLHISGGRIPSSSNSYRPPFLCFFYCSKSRIDSPIVPSGIFTPKFSVMVAPRTAKL